MKKTSHEFYFLKKNNIKTLKYSFFQEKYFDIKFKHFFQQHLINKSHSLLFFVFY
jgi:hypothetical protein